MTLAVLKLEYVLFLNSIYEEAILLLPAYIIVSTVQFLITLFSNRSATCPTTEFNIIVRPPVYPVSKFSKILFIIVYSINELSANR